MITSIRVVVRNRVEEQLFASVEDAKSFVEAAHDIDGNQADGDFFAEVTVDREDDAPASSSEVIATLRPLSISRHVYSPSDRSWRQVQ